MILRVLDRVALWVVGILWGAFLGAIGSVIVLGALDLLVYHGTLIPL